jgi:hypothetical protein
METRTRTVIGGISVLAFLAGSLASAALLDLVQPLVGGAAPTTVCVTEMKVAVAIFLASIVLMEPARDALETRASSVAKLMRVKVHLPWPALVGCALVAAFGGFVFVFWSVADLLGGYNGYGFAFAHHPLLAAVYENAIRQVPFMSSWDKGVQASLCFGLACLALTLVRLDRGVGVAVKDVVTLLAAPILVIFELGLWYFAPQDMTWHVTDYLWMGGVADGGWRANDIGGAYLFSNWLVLCVALLLVAYRVPWLSLPSRIIWRKRINVSRRADMQTSIDQERSTLRVQGRSRGSDAQRLERRF